MSKKLLVGSAAALFLAASIGIAYAQQSEPAAFIADHDNVEIIVDSTVLSQTVDEYDEPEEQNSVIAEEVLPVSQLSQPLDYVPAAAEITDAELPESGFSGVYYLNGEKGDSVYSIADGTVEYAGWYFGWGNVVSICHDDGTYSFYAHLNKTTVNSGDKVASGEEIGEVGVTGQAISAGLAFFRSDVSYLDDNGIYDYADIAYDAFDGVYYETASDGGVVCDAEGNVVEEERF